MPRLNANPVVAMFAVILLLAACGGSNFSSDDNKKGGQQITGGNASGDNPDAGTEAGGDTVFIEGDDLSDDDLAINKCLEKFGSHPFDRNQVKAYRKISASVQVLGAGNTVKDTDATPGPALILISAAVNVLGSAEYQLLNPNGYYCLKVDVNVLANSTINLHCNAKLADNKVGVNVGSSGETAGRVGVNVGSEVTINNVGGNCGG